MNGYLALATATCSVIVVLLGIILVILGMITIGLIKRINKLEYVLRTHWHNTQLGQTEKPGWMEMKEENGM